MTPEMKRLRARVAALEEGLDEALEEVAPGVWSAPSRSRPGDFHIVTRLRDGALLCSCEGASAGQPCRHREAVAVLLEREQWEQQEQARAVRRRKHAMPAEAFIDAMGGSQGALPADDAGEDEQRQSWYSAPRPLKRVSLT